MPGLTGANDGPYDRSLDLDDAPELQQVADHTLTLVDRKFTRRTPGSVRRRGSRAPPGPDAQKGEPLAIYGPDGARRISLGGL